MSLNRRAFIRIAGSTAVIAAAGAGTFAMTREPSKALEPWYAAASAETDFRRRALAFAILAPNPHNRQPWMVELVGDRELVLHCDPERLLPVTDPYNRQITIGLGCFLEIMRMAAAEQGYGARITPFPDGYSDERLDERLVARVVFDDTGTPDPLFRHVLQRRSNKEPFDAERSVPQDAIEAISGSAAGIGGVIPSVGASPDLVADMRDLTWRGFVTEMETREAAMESVHLMRIGKAEIEANPDGIDMGGVKLETLSLLGLLTREAIADPTSAVYRQGLDMYRDITSSGMAYFWLTTPGNTRLDQLDAGAAYVRANLQATALGIAMHPLSQVLQEYEEMEALLEEVHRELKAPEGSRIQMLARLGYGPELKPSPRWPADTRLKPA